MSGSGDGRDPVRDWRMRESGEGISPCPKRVERCLIVMRVDPEVPSDMDLPGDGVRDGGEDLHSVLYQGSGRCVGHTNAPSVDPGPPDIRQGKETP